LRRPRVLDIGCGTGKQVVANRARWPDLVLVGVDRFAGMLRIAQRRCADALWIQGDGAELPLADGAFDYVTSQFSYQHVRRTPALLREVFRVLRPAGRFVMTNIDPWSMRGWLVYRFFPEALAIDRVDFLPADRFAAEMGIVGFRGVEVSRVDLSRPEGLAEFLDWVSERHRASQLMAIPDAAYARGLQRVRHALEAGEGGDAPAPSEFVLVTIAGSKPAGH
jgi:SAM-dependent methyltransferase